MSLNVIMRDYVQKTLWEVVGCGGEDDDYRAEESSGEIKAVEDSPEAAVVRSYRELDRLLSEAYWLGYLAGIIDGEGTITIVKHGGPSRMKKYGHPEYTVRVYITNTCLEMLEELKKRFGGRIRVHNNVGEGHNVKAKKTSYRLTWSGLKAINLLKKLRLIVKENQRQIAIEFAKYCHFHTTEKKSKWKIEKQEELYKKMRELNKR